jgi:protein tyrosine/serine phosphatase
MTVVFPKFTCILSVASLAALLCTPAYAQQSANATVPAASEHAFAQKIFLNGVANFGEITPEIYRGAQPSEEGFSVLAKMGVAIVINLRADRDSEREQVTALGMQYVAIPSRCSHMKHDDIAKFLSILRGNPDKKIFVHCQFGVDRTGMMIAAYRIAGLGWTAEESRREMEAFGFSRAHRMVCPGLASFESKFPDTFAKDSAFEKLRSATEVPTPAQQPTSSAAKN